jgi:hypothetical protein
LREQGARVRATASTGRRLLGEGTIYLALAPFGSGVDGARGALLRAHLADIFPEWFGADRRIEVTQ